MGYFSNGSEASDFEMHWCANCVHSDWREGKDLGDADNPPCPVWMAHQLFSYELCNQEDDEGKQILDMLIPQKAVGVNECAMFAGRDGATPGQAKFEFEIGPWEEVA